MKRKKALALLLTVCLLASMTMPVFAAGGRGSWSNSQSSQAEASNEAAGADSSSSGTETEISLSVGKTTTVTNTTGNYGTGTQTLMDTEENTPVATVAMEGTDGITNRVLGSQLSMPSSFRGTQTGVLTDGAGSYLTLDGSEVTTTEDLNAAVEWTVTRTNLFGTSAYTIKSGAYYLGYSASNSVPSGLTASSSSATWYYSAADGFYVQVSSGSLLSRLFRTSTVTNYYLRSGEEAWALTTSASEGTSVQLYSYTEDTEETSSTTLTFTGVNEGDTSVTVGDTVYAVSVLSDEDGSSATTDSQTVEITVKVGETKVLTEESGDYSSNTIPDDVQNYADIALEATTTAAHDETELVNEISSGGSYLILSQSSSTLLNNEEIIPEGYSTQLKLNGSLSADTSKLWTFTQENDYWTISDSNGKYLSIGDGTASLSDTAVSLVVSYEENYSAWTIAVEDSNSSTGGYQYLNKHGATQQAAGWKNNDDGSKWSLYQIKTVEAHDSTSVSITGKNVTTTPVSVTVGNTTYKITVVPREETVTLITGKTATATLDGTVIEGQLTNIDAQYATVALENDVLTFTGVADGTTNVTVGNVTYTVKVATIKYVPVTLYNYDSTINNATHELEVTTAASTGDQLTQWSGIYFNDGTPENESYDTGYTRVGPLTYSELTANITINEVTDSGYYCEDKATGYYYFDGSNYSSVIVSWTKGVVSDSSYSPETYDFYTIHIGAGNYICAQFVVKNQEDSAYVVYANYWSGSTPANYVEGEEIIFYTRNDDVESLPYADCNRWTGVSGGAYSGLVQNTLDKNKNIVFTVPEGGIFNSDSSVKDIYTNVQLPFQYDATTQKYTFDSDTFGAYFHTDTDQGTSSTPSSNSTLYYSAIQQTLDFNSYSSWLPFTDRLSGIANTMRSGSGADADGKIVQNDYTTDYWFGMNATVQFTMTADGKMLDGETPITFDFSGDDDVWIFIDGTLVLDLGGIHDEMEGHLNFANNTWSISRAVNPTDATSASGAIFNGEDADGNAVTGTLNMTRETFAATDGHELTIYYLERGESVSNCKIQFNLPMRDVVSVQKIVDTKDDQGYALSEETLEQVNSRDFSFILYKVVTDEDREPVYEAVANTTYYIYTENNQYLSTSSTRSDGTFTLKNGQIAKFFGQIADYEGSTYFVYEQKDTKEGSTLEWNPPVYTDSVVATDWEDKGAVSEDIAEGSSNQIHVVGNPLSVESVSFVCTNQLVHKDSLAYELRDDIIVIDYGLPVEIDVLSNDVVTGGTLSLNEEVPVTGAQYGTAKFENGKIVYTLNQQLHDVEVLTYTVKGTNSDGSPYEVKDGETMTACVYIVPATVMYYEEDFTDEMITFSVKDENNTAWEHIDPSENPFKSEFQEPGVVGTPDDSPYGSDVAYLNDSVDSNGTCWYVDTTKGSATFSYEFTGTGTTIFARTSNNSGYIRVVVTGGPSDGINKTTYRDTSYKTEDNGLGGSTNVDGDTLYNIPVYTIDGLEYGTYNVTVTIAGGSTIIGHYGTEFWLDGVRVINPLFEPADMYPEDETQTGQNLTENQIIGQNAYATDGESNMTVATLRDKMLAENAIGQYVDAITGEIISPVTNENGEEILDENDNPTFEEGQTPICDDDGNPIPQLVWDGTNFVVFTDTNSEIKSAEEYKSNGPKEEVYLTNGQSVTFSLYDWDTENNHIYLGIKAPAGCGTVTINGNPLTINNATDCYYDITSFAHITTDEDGVKTVTFEIKATSYLISVTNIKVTGNVIFTIVNEENVDENFEGSEG